MDILSEPSQGDVINALTTLANVATHSESHVTVRNGNYHHSYRDYIVAVLQLKQLRISDKIKLSSHSDPSVHYQVIRLLVYIGESWDEHYSRNCCLFSTDEFGKPNGC